MDTGYVHNIIGHIKNDKDSMMRKYLLTSETISMQLLLKTSIIKSIIMITMTCVGNLPEGYIRSVPLPRVPRDQSTFQSRVPPVHTIPGYYEDMYVIPTYNSTGRIGEREGLANSSRWQPLAINT